MANRRRTHIVEREENGESEKEKVLIHDLESRNT